MAALVAVPVLLAGCAGMAVRYDYDRNAAFAAYRTFNWYVPAAPPPPAPAVRAANPIMDRRVHRIVEQELAARGYRLESAQEPDFLVVCYPLYQDRLVQTYTDYGPGWGYAWGMRPWGYGFGGGYAEVHRYREGSLVLEMVDSKSGQVVWHAVAEGALTGLRDPQDADEQVALAVRRMLAKFPPPPPR
jgi:hypothetical protein